MITVYIWTDGAGHASMKITRAAGTKYYSWWPTGAASVLNPSGGATEGSGVGHPRRNPVAYGDSKLNTQRDLNGDRVVPEGTRRIQDAPQHPGGGYAYNRSDKDMEDSSANVKFYFRPSAGLDAAAAEVVWAKHMNKSAGEGKYNFLTNSCCTTVMKALKAAAANVPVAKPKGGIVQPKHVIAYCLELARALNNNLLLHANGLPPVVMANEKGVVNRFVDPGNNSPVAGFTQQRRHEATQ